MITGQRNKLLIVAAACALTTAAVSAAAAAWASGSRATTPAGTAFSAITVRPGLTAADQDSLHYLAAQQVKATAERQALTVLAHRQAPRIAAPAPSGSAQSIAKSVLGSFGWPSSQFSCLQPLWAGESGWSVTASNPATGAFGIPQALPGSKMASAGPDWRTNAATQIRWGLGYIESTYGSPCAAWSHEQADGWY